ncbi:MAG: DUF4260 family protein [Promethearchaeota archaeon]
MEQSNNTIFDKIRSAGQVRIFLTIEAISILILSIITFVFIGGNWILFFIFFFGIDSSMIGYLKNPKIGSQIYNLGHIYLWSVLFVVVSIIINNFIILQIGTIWAVHVSFDRTIQAGMKYPTKFQDTHMTHL